MNDEPKIVATRAGTREPQIASRLLDNTVDLVFAFDKELRVITWNALAERLTGIGRAQIIGKPIAGIQALAELTGNPDYFARTLHGENFYLHERPYFIATYGSTGCFDIDLAPLRDEDGAVNGGIGIVHDITRYVRSDEEQRKLANELRVAMADLNETQQLLRAVMDSTHHLIWSVEPQTFGLVTFNESLRKYAALRWGMHLNRGVRPEELLAPEFARQWHHFYHQALTSGPFSTEYAPRPDSVVLLLHFNLLYRDSTISGISVFAEDITERKQAERALQQAAEVFENTAEGVLITDPDGVILRVNRAFSEVTGYASEEVLGHKPNLLKSGRHDQSFYAGMWTAILTIGHWHGEIWNRRKNGEIYPEWLTISAVRDASGATREFVGLFSDLSTVKRSQEQLEFLAHHDPLTRLPNRALLRARLEYAMGRAEREQGQFALLFVDIDRFKTINDSLGHSRGDLLLQGVAARLGELVRAEDTVARLGGDEFVLLLEGVTPGQAGQKAVDALTALARPFSAEGRELYVTGSIGIGVFPADGKDVDTLLRNADAAMYRAKDSGRNTFRFYEPEMTVRAQQRMTLEHALRGAMGRAELRVYYQPQVDLRNGRLLGVESLVRWQHPEWGLLLPKRFIPVAEEIGLISEIDRWVLGESCRQMSEWRRDGIAVPRIAVNISAQDLANASLPEQVRKALAESGIDAGSLELEVTESMIMNRADLAIAVLNGLREIGIALAVDDFGTGYSSLAYLRRLPLNRLKIDQSFVQDVTVDPNDAAIARAVIALGKTLGLEGLAEGVETEAQADFLRREGCAAAQGFLFGRPMPPGDMARVMVSA